MGKRLLSVATLLCLVATTVFAASFAFNLAPGNDDILVHRVNIIGSTDERGFLTELGPELGLSPNELRKIRMSTGRVVCPGTKYKNNSVASGALILSNDEVITTAHSFVDEWGRFREPLSECFFQNHAIPSEVVHIRFQHGSFRLGNRTPSNAMNSVPFDYAVVRLVHEVAGATPFPIDSSPVRKGQTIIGISADQERLPKAHMTTEPIVESCSVQKTYPEKDWHPTFYYSDCDLAGGASGGANLVRVRGMLMLRGIFVATGTSDQDHKPYDPEKRSFTVSIGTDGRVAKAAVRINRWRPLRSRRR